jgi:tetratricopeptide (TPR) repeat protein
MAAPAAPPLKATLTVTASDGYARLVFSAAEFIDATTKLSGHVLIITFKQPIDVSVDRVPEQATDYVGAARRDPDGLAIRMALSQDVTVNTMGAGEKLFIDLLPSSWTGAPPGLPQDVVTELARRAREAERELQHERQLTQAKYVAPIRVHVASQPTFTRYIFDVTGQTAVSADRSKDRLVLNFDAPLTFDLADAQSALPNGVQAINSELDQDASLVRFVFGASLDVRTFRDEKGYVVDVVKPDGAMAQSAAPQSVPPTKSGNEGTPSPEAAAAAIHAAASGAAQSNNAVPAGPPVEPPAPRRGGQSSVLPSASPTALLGALPNAATPAVAQALPAPVFRPAPPPFAPAPAAIPQPAPSPFAQAVQIPGQVPAQVAAQVPAQVPAQVSAQVSAQVLAPVAAAAPQSAAPALAQAALPLPQQSAPPVAPPAAAPEAQSASPMGSPMALPMASPMTSPMASPMAQAAPVAQPTPPSAAQTASAPGPAAAPVTPADPAAQPAPQAAPRAAPQTDQQALQPVVPPVAETVPAPAAAPQSAPAPAAQVAAGSDKSADTPAPRPAAAPRNLAPGAIGVELSRDGANLKLSFPFKTAVPTAVFHRADTLWIVFDSTASLDLSALDNEPTRTIRSYNLIRTDDADIVRLKLDRPHLATVAADGAMWTLAIADSVLEPPHALEITRNMLSPNRSSVSIGFDEPQHLHRLTDPEAGDTLFVITGFAPARGFINPQDFIEFHALASTQGIVIEPIADDLTISLAADKVVIDRPSGLTLSPALQTLLHGRNSRPATFDSQMWGSDREGSYFERQAGLIFAASEAPENKRMSPRLDLARFYLARDMYPEAKGVLDVALAADKPAREDVSAIVLRAIAEVMMDRPDDALKDLSDPAVGDQHDAPLWRALAFALQGQWARARQGFKDVEAAVATLPVELQRVALEDEMRAAIEVGDFDGASADLNDFQTIGVPRSMQPTVAVLMGRLDEGMGRSEDALSAYRTAADSWDRPAAAQGRLRETLLRLSLGDMKRDEVISQLESLTTIWRGDETEIEALKVLAHLYTEDGRYRDAFYVMRSAMAAHPNSAMTRQIQDEAAATFDSLFLAGKGDTMPPIDALALFYDFRELTPVGGRGDEMIRRLADRLVSVDLLDQAADLLQYQVDHRLQGAARAQIATRLAVIYLMNRKADRALAVLRGTRTADVSNELRNQRLLLEGRALSDTGRPDLALEVIANLDGREVTRLRSDILWSAKRWDESAEQIELMYGDRYKDFAPLSDVEQQDILRAEIGYALSSDTLGLGRFREKYAAKMADTPDAHVFEIVSAPLGSSGDQFAAVAHAATSIDTLEGFLREMKARYPESAGSPAITPGPMTTPSAAAPPQASSQQPDPAAPILPPAKPGEHSAQNVKNVRTARSSAHLSSAKSAQSVKAKSGRGFATAALDNHVR